MLKNKPGNDKLHWELVIKIHEYALLVQDFNTSSFVFPCLTVSEHVKCRLKHAGD